MAEDPKLTEELARQDAEYEPLLPIEKKLITWSLVIGVGGLVFLWLLSNYLFPVH